MAGLRKARTQLPPIQLQRTAALAQRHLEREGVSGLAQAVAEHAVEDGQHGLAPGPGRIVRDERGVLREGAIHAGAHPPEHPADAPVDQTGDARVGTLSGRPSRAGPPPMVRCIASTRSVTARVASLASRLAARRSPRGLRLVRVTASPRRPDLGAFRSTSNAEADRHLAAPFRQQDLGGSSWTHDPWPLPPRVRSGVRRGHGVRGWNFP